MFVHLQNECQQLSDHHHSIEKFLIMFEMKIYEFVSKIGFLFCKNQLGCSCDETKITKAPMLLKELFLCFSNERTHLRGLP